MAAARDTVPGLERLMQLAQVNIDQTETKFTRNKYTVHNEREVLFNLQEAGEATIFMSRGKIRPFHMDGEDVTGNKVFSFRRPRSWMSDRVELYMDNVLISVVHRKSTFLTPVFNINDASDQPVLRVKGGFGNVTLFQLQSVTKVNIGSIQKKVRSFMEEVCSYKDDYVICFPADLDVRFKLAVIAACIFILKRIVSQHNLQIRLAAKTFLQVVRMQTVTRVHQIDAAIEDVTSPPNRSSPLAEDRVCSE